MQPAGASPESSASTAKECPIASKRACWFYRVAQSKTARHLLINKTREFPSGLANSSGHVGKNLTSHFGLTVTGYFPQIRNRDASNDDGTDYYHALLTALYWDKPNPNFDGTYQVQCGSGVHPIGMAIRSAPGMARASSAS